jgi:hypothetical protein
VTAGNGIPPSESAPAPQLRELRIWRRTISNERLQSVKGRNPALVILMSAQFLEFVIHALSGLRCAGSPTSGARNRSENASARAWRPTAAALLDRWSAQYPLKLIHDFPIDLPVNSLVQKTTIIVLV